MSHISPVSATASLDPAEPGDNNYIFKKTTNPINLRPKEHHLNLNLMNSARASKAHLSVNSANSGNKNLDYDGSQYNGSYHAGNSHYWDSR